VLPDRFNSICDWARGLIADSFRERKRNAAPDGDAAGGEREHFPSLHIPTHSHTHTGCFSRRVERPECVTHIEISTGRALELPGGGTRERVNTPPSQARRAQISATLSHAGRPIVCFCASHNLWPGTRLRFLHTCQVQQSAKNLIQTDAKNPTLNLICFRLSTIELVNYKNRKMPRRNIFNTV
jgi:hypothetical protein